MVIHFKVHPLIHHIFISMVLLLCFIIYVMDSWQRVFSSLMKLIILARMSHSNYHHFLGIYQLMNSVIRLHFCSIIFHPHQALSLKWQSFSFLGQTSLTKCGKLKIHDKRSNTLYASHRFSRVHSSWPLHNFISLSHQNNQWAVLHINSMIFRCLSFNDREWTNQLYERFFFVQRSQKTKKKLSFRKLQLSR